LEYALANMVLRALNSELMVGNPEVVQVQSQFGQNPPMRSLIRHRQAEIGLCHGSHLAEIGSSSAFMISLRSL
jgi:hypothetical protein